MTILEMKQKLAQGKNVEMPKRGFVRKGPVPTNSPSASAWHLVLLDRRIQQAYRANNRGY